MGPTGTPTEIPGDETVLLAAAASATPSSSRSRGVQGLGAPVLYFAGYKSGEDLFKQDDIEALTDQVIWCTDMASRSPPPPAGRALPRQHRAGDARLRRGQLGGELVPLNDVNRIIAIGSRPDDARRPARPGTACSQPLSTRGTSASAASTRRCSA